jgi:hypothetical protein
MAVASADVAGPTKTAVGVRQDIFLVRDFLTRKECSDFIELSENAGYEGAKIATAAGHVVAKDIRNNDRLIWSDDRLARQWWDRAGAFFPPSFGRWQAIGFNERFRFYRYEPGQKFAQHVDLSFERSSGEISWMTFMVYLNANYTGGNTKFDLSNEPNPVVVTPEQGTALAFMHDRLHEGEELITGVKYVLRTDVMYRRV